MVTHNQSLNKRMNYFERQFLRAQDLADEQDYHLDRRSRHNRFLHVYGVANGLDVIQTQPTKDMVDLTSVTVAPGYAIDEQGHEIVLLAPYKVPMPTSQGLVEIYIRYQENGTDPSALQGIQGNTRMDDTPDVNWAISGQRPPDALLLAQVQLDPATGKVIENGIKIQHRSAGAQIQRGAVSIAQLSATEILSSDNTAIMITVPAASAANTPSKTIVPILTADEPAFLLIKLNCNDLLPNGSNSVSVEWWQQVSLMSTGNPPTLQHVHELVIQNANLFTVSVTCKAYRLNET